MQPGGNRPEPCPRVSRTEEMKTSGMMQPGSQPPLVTEPGTQNPWEGQEPKTAIGDTFFAMPWGTG